MLAALNARFDLLEKKMIPGPGDRGDGVAAAPPRPSLADVVHHKSTEYALAFRMSRDFDNVSAGASAAGSGNHMSYAGKAVQAWKRYHLAQAAGEEGAPARREEALRFTRNTVAAVVARGVAFAEDPSLDTFTARSPDRASSQATSSSYGTSSSTASHSHRR